MNHALTWMGHRWFGPVAVALAALLGPLLADQTALTWGLCALLFVVVGLPHGAVDHITYHHALGRNAKTAPWRFVAPYLAGLCVFAAAFVWAPVLATWAFLVLASWHFGQSHVEVRTSEWLDRLRGFALGALILGTLLDAQSGAASDVMAIWMSESGSVWILRTVGVGLPMLKLLWTVTAFMAWQRNPEGRTMSTRLLREASWVVAMWGLAQTGELLWAFTAYFCLGHAADSWRGEFLHHQSLTSQFWTYYRWAWPFTLVSLVGLAAVAGAAFAGWIGLHWAWAILIAGSVPHMVLLDHWAPAQLRAERSG